MARRKGSDSIRGEVMLSPSADALGGLHVAVDRAALRSHAILWWLLGLLAVAGMALLGHGLWRDYEARLDHAAQATTNASRFLSGHARRIVLSTDAIVRRAVEVMEAAPDEAWRTDPAIWTELKAVAEAVPGTDSLWILDAHGDMALISTAFPAPAISGADREYFKAHAVAGKDFHVGPTVRGKITGGWFFTISRPIRDAAGRFRGVAVAAIDIDTFIDFHRQDGIGPQSSFLVVREDGQVLVRQPYAGEIEGRRVNDIAEHATASREGAFESVSPFDGASRILSYKKDSMLPIIVAVTVAREDVLKPWWETLRRAVLGSAVVYSFLVIAAWLAWRSGRQEVAAIGALRRSHDDLEQKVLERTAALDAQRAAAQRGVEQLSFALDAARAGAWEWDIKSGRVEWSEGSYRLYGVSDLKDLTFEKWRSLIHPDDGTAVDTLLQTTFATRSPSLQLEFRVLRPDGLIRWFAGIGKIVYDANGFPVRVTGLTLDVTGLKQAEMAMREAKLEAERANVAKSKFLASASHDLRQPFQAMRLFHDLLLGMLTDERARMVANKLSEAMRSGEDLLGALLDVSTLDAGVVRVSPEPFRIDEVLARVVTESEPQARAKGLRLRYVSTEAVVVSDRVLLARMIRNLVVNAIRYTDAGGIVVGCRRRGGELRIEVCDSGIGIPADKVSLVFEDFYQVDNEARDKSKGLGLGLAVVARTARLLGHKVDVRTRRHHGSVFALTVPLAKAETAPRLAVLQPPVTLM